MLVRMPVQRAEERGRAVVTRMHLRQHHGRKQSEVCSAMPLLGDMGRLDAAASAVACEVATAEGVKDVALAVGETVCEATSAIMVSPGAAGTLSNFCAK